MKKCKIHNGLIFGLLILVIIACDPNENPFLDLNNPTNSLAVFVEDNQLVYNPAENVDNMIMVGVSTLSEQDRTFELSIDESTTLGDDFYDIPSLTGVIPAGSLFGSLIVRTLGNENDGLPGAVDQLVLKLESVEGAIVESFDEIDDISVTVACPSVDLNELVGAYDVVALSFGASFPGQADFPRTVVAGPEDNQITIVEGAYPDFGGEELVLTIDLGTGDIIAVEPNVMTTSFGGNNYAFRSGGIVFTCAGIINVNLDFDGPVAGNPVIFDLVKQ